MNWQSLLDIVFPHYCAGCGRHADNKNVLCRDCLENIKLNETFFCGRCGARLPEARRVCHPDFPYLLGAAAAYDDKTVKNLVRLLKFKYIKSAAEPLAELMFRYATLTSIKLKNFTAVPVPLPSARLRRRGYNQAELIAENLSSRLGLPLINNALVRPRDSKPQSETKNLSERLKNVRACFAVKNPVLVRGKNILLIDDVTTSGATLLTAAKALKAAGARRIIALTAARA